ncbi:MAG: leucine-rich repeat domain-containing protein [Spirochaetaceae bacterium]|jgi:hypothetical protein|nr:leucine-rich repeat domain-containing protein [Spirochaetaceae bacterium]
MRGGGGIEDTKPDEKDKRVNDTDLTAKVPMPVAGREPKTDFSLNQYRGAVSWTPDLPDSGLFEIDTVYEARVTLTAAPGWTLYDVSAFTHEDADEVDYTPGSASVTIKFPATETSIPDTVNDTDLTAKVPKPVAGGTATTYFSSDQNQYTGAVSWSPALSGSGCFKGTTVYQALVTLTAAPGWTFYGVSAFTHQDATGAVNFTQTDAFTATVTITFPATDILVIESPGDIAPTLGDDPGGATTGTAVPLKVKLSLPGNWTAILGAIQQAGKYVSLDLSGCAMTNGGTFDPVESIDTGKNKIVSLVLPDAATRIVEGFGRGSTVEDDRIPFRHFSALENVSGLNIERIGECAFWYVITLKTADFPKATSIGVAGFCDCKALTTVNLPKLRKIEGGTFIDTKLKTADFPELTDMDLDAGLFAFWNCGLLETISFPKLTGKTMGLDMFISSGDNLRSVTIGANCDFSHTHGSGYFPGFVNKYDTSGKAAGTYTRSGSTWTKQN